MVQTTAVTHLKHMAAGRHGTHGRCHTRYAWQLSDVVHTAIVTHGTHGSCQTWYTWQLSHMVHMAAVTHDKHGSCQTWQDTRMTLSRMPHLGSTQNSLRPVITDKDKHIMQGTVRVCLWKHQSGCLERISGAADQIWLFLRVSVMSVSGLWQ